MASMREVTVKVTPVLSPEFEALLGTATERTIEKVDAGSALVNAIYHHPRAKEFLASEFWSPGLSDAYQRACKAYGIGRAGRL